MENLHGDILENILSRLPIEAALHAKRVCTTWKAILRYKTDEKTGLLFAFSHAVERDSGEVREELFYEYEYDHYDDAKINYYHSYNTLTKIEHGRFITKSSTRNIMVGSCNGLVCFGTKNKEAVGADPFLICNPLTGESVFLPRYDYGQLPRDHGVSNRRLPYGCLTSGFGYCPSTNVYKVVTIFCFHREYKRHVQVYTVGGGGEWRYIEFIDRYDRYSTFNISSSGIYANGKLYWLQENAYIMVQEREIVAFDLKGEYFEYITVPCSKDFEYITCLCPLKLLGGNNNLHLVHTNNGASRIDVWIYKRNDIKTDTSYSYSMEDCDPEQNHQSGSSSCWIEKFSIHKDVRFLKPFAFTRNNEVLLWHDNYIPFRTRLYCYDRKTLTLTGLWDKKAKGMKCIYIEAIPHRQSIVSLEDLGETNVACLKDLEKLMLQGTAEEFGKTDVTISRDAKRLKNC